MAKPTPKRIKDCADCAVKVDGTVYHPHEGEWIDILTLQNLEELQAFLDLQQMQVTLDAIKGETNEKAQTVVIVNGHLQKLRECLADRVMAWNWTDLKGKPLPPPDGTPGPLGKLVADEIMWLVLAGQGETPTERKNDSPPSPTTSLDTESQATGASKSTTGRSRTQE